jgi:plasmid stabilization system protein ParE
MTPPGELQFTFLACDDLASIWDSIALPSDMWSTRHAANAVATKAFVREFKAHGELLAANPEVGRERNELLFGMRSLVFQNFTIFYRVRGTSIVVLRVLRSSRDLDAPV